MALVVNSAAFIRSLSSLSSDVPSYFHDDLFSSDNFSLFDDEVGDFQLACQPRLQESDKDGDDEYESPSQSDTSQNAPTLKITGSTDMPLSNSKPIDVRPKEFPNTIKSRCKKVKKSTSFHLPEEANCVPTSKNERKKVRQKSTKKWKPACIDDFGFHVSLLAKPTSWEDDNTNDKDDNCDADDESDGASPCKCEGACFHGSGAAYNFINENNMRLENKENNIQENSITGDFLKKFSNDIGAFKPSISATEKISSEENEKDDVQYFLDLGIDVTAYDYDEDAEDAMFWDGVSFAKNDKIPRAFSRCLTQPTDRKQINSTKVHGNFKTSQRQIQPRIHHVTTKTAQFSTHTPLRLKTHSRLFLFDLECYSKKRIYIRRDRHRRVQKAHKAVKSKNCASIFNNLGRKKLFMHHRLLKKNDLCLEFRSSPRAAGRPPPMPKVSVDPQAAKAIFKANRPANAHSARAAPAQNLKHALHETNRPQFLQQDLDLASFLISLQHRELTPEDYDMLLRLDDTVKPKTVSKNILDNLKTEVVGPDGAPDSEDGMPAMCAVCMEPYTAGQKRKFLPCRHNFHADCIDTWLKNSSMNCPLDGLPIEQS